MPMPRVSCRWSDSVRSGKRSRTLPTSSRIDFGVAQAMVSASENTFGFDPVLGADVQQLLDQVEHALVRDLAFEIAAERRHDAGALQRDAVLLIHAAIVSCATRTLSSMLRCWLR